MRQFIESTSINANDFLKRVSPIGHREFRVIFFYSNAVGLDIWTQVASKCQTIENKTWEIEIEKNIFTCINSFPRKVRKNVQA